MTLLRHRSVIPVSAGPTAAVVALLVVLIALPHPSAASGLFSASLEGAPLRLAVAADRDSRIRGLSGVRTMAWDQGMLFVYSRPGVRNFWMVEMKMSIDIIWLKGGVVTGIAADMPPPPPGRRPATAKSPGPADMVLEVNAGWARANGVRVGSRLISKHPWPRAGD